MKLLLDNIQKTILCLFLCYTSVFTFAQEIDPTDVSYVSLNPYTSEVTVSWYKSESPNIKFARILYIYDETTLIKGKGIVDITGNEDNSFAFKTDTIAIFPYNADERPISIAVDAYSENGTNSTSLREYHTTMVSTAKTTVCPSQILIAWTGYYGYGITVEKYEIIESINGSEVVVKECLPSEKTCLINLNETAERFFYVRATFQDCRGTLQFSNSSMCSIIKPMPISPKFINAENISIDGTDVAITFKYDTAADYKNYVVYKSEFDTNHFIGIDTITLDSNSSPIYIYHDTQAYKKDTLVFYKSAVFDNCGIKLIESQILTPILLTIREISDEQNMIEWTKNIPWNEASYYRIYMSENNESEQLVDSVTSNTYIYIDYIDDATHSFSRCYHVESVNNFVTPSYISSTNSVCLNKDYKILIPNIFNPTSEIDENQIFKPKFAFITGEYSLKIIDRFGTTIFTSNNIEIGWDGKVKGKIAPTGMYQYSIQITLPNGENIDRHGVVHLIYN